MPTKKILMGIVIYVLIISIILVIITNESSSQVINKGGTSSDSEVSGLFAIMLETEALSGVYEETESSTWPGDGYVFNRELSTCVNGSELSWDNETNSVLVLADSAERCYVYFDVSTFAKYIVSLYTSDGVNGLYYHDGEGTYTNATYEAGDNSYRYAGADPDNYVCFGYNAISDCSGSNNTDYLYRIIGVFDDGDGYQVKLIKADYATTSLVGTNGEYVRIYASYSNYQGDLNLSDIGAYYWWSGDDGTNTWSDSALNTVNLNENFLTNIGTNWSNLIAYHYWRVGGMSTTYGMYSNAQTAYNYEVGSYASGTTHSAKIGLMYVSDYYYAAEPTYWTYEGYGWDSSSGYALARDYNWMYMGLYEWTITPVVSSTANIFWVNYNGYVHNSNPAGGNRVAIRPTFYLDSDVEYVSGEGTKTNPYIIS